MTEPDLDSELGKPLGAQNAQAQQALNGSIALAGLLIAFRVQLIIGGFTPEDAVDFTREYFVAMLDQMRGTSGATDAPPDD